MNRGGRDEVMYHYGLLGYIGNLFKIRKNGFLMSGKRCAAFFNG